MLRSGPPTHMLISAFFLAGLASAVYILQFVRRQEEDAAVPSFAPLYSAYTLFLVTLGACALLAPRPTMRRSV